MFLHFSSAFSALFAVRQCAFLFWLDVPESQAFANLRKALHRRDLELLQDMSAHQGNVVQEDYNFKRLQQFGNQCCGSIDCTRGRQAVVACIRAQVLQRSFG